MKIKFVKLNEVCNVDTGNPAPQGDKYFDGGKFPFVRVKHISDVENGFIKKADLVNELAIEEKKLKLYPKGSIIFAKSGMSIHLNKKARLNQDSYVVSHLAIISPKSNILNSDYLYFWSKQFNFSTLSSGTTLPSIKTSDIKKVKIPVPPIEEQKKIVEILEKAEKLKEKREKANQKTEKIIQSIFYEMFGDPIKNEKGWEVRKLENVCLITMGQSPSGKSYNSKNIGMPFFQGKAEFTDKYTIVKKWTTEPTKLAKKNDILISVRAPVGSVNLSNIDCCIGRGLASIRPNNNFIKTEYLFIIFKLSQKSIENLGVGSTFKSISSQQLKNIKIIIPPLSLQEEFEKKVKLIESIKKKQKKSTEEINTLFDALMQKAFRGELV